MTLLATHPLSFMRGVFCAHTASAIDDLGLRPPTSGGSALYCEEGLNECLPRANPILPQSTIPGAFPVSMPLLYRWMAASRLPRFKRTSAVAAIRLGRTAG